MTMPHLMNCRHSEEGWCLACVKEMYDEKEAEKLAEIVEAGKYEYTLQAAAQILQIRLPIGQVKHIGQMEVPDAIDCYIQARDSEVRELVEALEKILATCFAGSPLIDLFAAIEEAKPILAKHESGGE